MRRQSFIIVQVVMTAAITASTAFEASPDEPEFAAKELDELAARLRLLASRNQIENLRALLDRALHPSHAAPIKKVRSA